MKNLKSQVAIWVQLITFVVIWYFILKIYSIELTSTSSVLMKFPDAVGIYLILLMLFKNWLWKLGIFKRWLVTVPIIEGKWFGTINSTWKANPSDNVQPPIRIEVAIRQKFDSISLIFKSDESESFSSTAQINEGDESGEFILTYNYTNRSKVTIRERSPIHDGAAILKILSDKKVGAIKLDGEYWTSRKTVGTISLSRTPQ